MIDLPGFPPGRDDAVLKGEVYTMAKLGIALDLGTSGFRGQAVDLDNGGQIVCTAVTTRHPLPGANVMDHLHFAVELGATRAHEIVIHAVNQVIQRLDVQTDDVIRLGICGNPIQLSLFQNIEIRDLAYAGKHKLEALGVVPPKRDACILKAGDISGLKLPDGTDILIPPAVRHEIGADALAMMIQTHMLDRDEIAIATDYGTNAEMALIADGIVYTGSTAAGPALEGQHIEDGILALPGAICDLESSPGKDPDSRPFNKDTLQKYELSTWVLDPKMQARPGDTLDPVTGSLIRKGTTNALGITGTGVIALISQAVASGLIRIPKIMTPDSKIHLPDGIVFTERDLKEAGKAIGAVRAGHIALCREAGINLEDIETAYMAGASGTYVDALKAQKIGMLPKGVKKIYQVGNSSLAMAVDMVRDVDTLQQMKKAAARLRQHHCMFADSKIFEKVYILELSYWTEGMSPEDYNQFLKRFKLPPVIEKTVDSEVIRTVTRDIPDIGQKGLRIISDIGEKRCMPIKGCTGCGGCIEECPEQALFLEGNEPFSITMDLAKCNGLACKRCEKICPENVFHLTDFYLDTPHYKNVSIH